MKTQGMLSGSTAALAAIAFASTSAQFLLARQNVIRLLPMSPQPNAGYVWRRVFLRRKSA